MDNSTQNPFDWKTAIQETYEKVFYNIVEFAPQFVGALALLVVGWLVARFLDIITRKTISRLDALFQKVTYGSSIHQEKLKESQEENDVLHETLHGSVLHRENKYLKGRSTPVQLCKTLKELYWVCLPVDLCKRKDLKVEKEIELE